MYGLRLWNSKIIKSKHFLCCFSFRHMGIKTGKNENVAADEFVSIYKFPYIRTFSVINRLKIYQTVLTLTSMPSALILNQMDLIDTSSLLILSALGTSGCLTLYGLGLLTTKFIGFIYYNESKNLAKISFLDFWGNRKEIFVAPDDLIPINELPTSPLDGLFYTIRRYSTKETLRLSLKFCVIEDKETMKKVL